MRPDAGDNRPLSGETQEAVTHSHDYPVAFVDEGLGNSSYLLDLGDDRALIVDPAREATPYLAAAERAGLST